MRGKERRITKFLIFGIVLFLINFVKFDCCESVFADIKTGTVCEPVTVRICSICGNDYDNPEVCPHHIDEQYNGDICSPTSGRICSICGGDYEDGSICPHHEGEEYGGEVCEPVRICDICGGNYDDGNECPHYEGETYGGEVCTVETVEICNICGNDYHDGSVCSHLRDNYYDDEWCEPEDTRICSICGGDYDDGSECPHHEGETYGEEVCTITRICNICGGNYDDGSECPHHEGDTYGSTECTVSDGRLCNICGYNYDDGGVCPHKLGQMYNGDVCEANEVRFCNICGNNYDDPSVCPHKEGTFYEDIAYIFYISERAQVASLERQWTAQHYNILEENVFMIEVCSEQDFVDGWNDMGEEDGKLYNIVAVEIHMHGGHNSMGDGDGTTYITPYILKMKVEEKSVSCVVLISCNVGNIDYSKSNMAANFAKKIKGGKVVASDGTVFWEYSGWAFTKIHYTSKCDNAFYNDAVDETRDNAGWLVYQYIDNEIVVSEPKGKDFTLHELYSLAE